MTDAADIKDQLRSKQVSELREILAEPGRWTPDMVHAAALELAWRKAVPRYYARLKRRQEGKGGVYRSHEGLLRLFRKDSDGLIKLRSVAAVACLMTFLAACLNTWLAVAYFKRVDPSLVRDWAGYIRMGLTPFYQAALAWFLFTLQAQLGSQEERSSEA